MGRPVLMDFYADWCGPCQVQTPIVEELAKRMGDQVEVRKIDVAVQDNQDLARMYQVYVVPTLIIEKDSQVVRRIEGLMVGPLDSSRFGMDEDIDKAIRFLGFGSASEFFEFSAKADRRERAKWYMGFRSRAEFFEYSVQRLEEILRPLVEPS